MTEELKSEGKCLYCGKMFSQKEIGKHLAEHLTIMEKESVGMENESTGKRVSNYVHVEVEAGEMFLHLLVKGNAQMKVIDQFLRDIWLECCGHLSAFGHKNFKVAMSHRVEAVNICTACWYEEEAFFCEACSEKHAEECEDFNDYAQMPVVNSPRMGVCGYTGGTIDLVRDEPYTR